MVINARYDRSGRCLARQMRPRSPLETLLEHNGKWDCWQAGGLVSGGIAEAMAQPIHGLHNISIDRIAGGMCQAITKRTITCAGPDVHLINQDMNCLVRSRPLQHWGGKVGRGEKKKNRGRE